MFFFKSRNILQYHTKYTENIINTVVIGGYTAGSAVGWGTALQAGRSLIRFPMVSLEFFIDIIIPAALCP
jgi:hypothetical protein